MVWSIGFCTALPTVEWVYAFVEAGIPAQERDAIGFSWCGWRTFSPWCFVSGAFCRSLQYWGRDCIYVSSFKCRCGGCWLISYLSKSYWGVHRKCGRWGRPGIKGYLAFQKSDVCPILRVTFAVIREKRNESRLKHHLLLMVSSCWCCEA